MDFNEDTHRYLLKVSGEYPLIDKVGLKNIQRGSKLCLNYLRDARNTNERHHFLASRMLLSEN